MSDTVRISVRCGDATHHIDIDPVLLKALPRDHSVTMERYSALEDLGGDPPKCYKMCKAFNEFAAPFRDKPDKFWELASAIRSVLQYFARTKTEEDAS